MKKIVMTCLLLSVTQSRAMDNAINPFPLILVVGAVSLAVYDYWIKDPHEKLKEQFAQEMENSRNTDHLRFGASVLGITTSEQRQQDIQQLTQHLSNQPNKTPTDTELLTYVSGLSKKE